MAEAWLNKSTRLFVQAEVALLWLGLLRKLLEMAIVAAGVVDPYHWFLNSTRLHTALGDLRPTNGFTCLKRQGKLDGWAQ